MKASLGLILARAVLFGGAALMGTYVYTQKPSASATEKPETERREKASVRSKRATEEDETPAPRPPKQGTIRDSIAQLLKKEGGKLFPNGTRIVGARISEAEKVATLDFSEEFKGIEAMGESVESEAQKAIIGALVRFPVEKARVLVEGKPFASASVDWSEPFQVQ